MSNGKSNLFAASERDGSCLLRKISVNYENEAWKEKITILTVHTR